jgi:N-acetylglutamate synthase-like GNAT family acetyltransferase
MMKLKIDHLVLTSIFVTPSYRKHGIGSQLVQLCIDKAKSAQLPLFLCSVPTSHQFYLKLGFKDVSYVDIDLSNWAPGYSGYGVYRLYGMKLDN